MTQDGEIIDHGLDAIGGSTAWLRMHLAEGGVRLHPDSELGRGLDELDSLAARAAQVVRFPSASEAYHHYLRATGVDFLSKALHRARLRGLEGFARHIRTLGSGNPVLTGPSEAGSGARDASWELLLASLIASFAAAVAEEEPDLVCSYRGAKVGVAAKVLYSKNSDQLLKLIAKGAKQLERSAAEHGFVVVNLVEVFPHTRMFENFRRGRVATGIAAQQIVHVTRSSGCYATGASDPSCRRSRCRRTTRPSRG